MRWAALLAMLAAGPAAEPPVIGIDHIPFVVADLESSKSDYAAMGFALKPGRPHDNGLRNAHVKFADGTALELITAPAPTDALATEYFEHARRGDGPIYFGLYAPRLAELERTLAQRGVRPEGGSMISFAASSPLHRLFFGGRQKSPTDRPEHFAHANSAVGVTAVWIVGGAEQRLVASLQTSRREARPCSPFGAGATALILAQGEVVSVTPKIRPAADRAVVGATVQVRSLAVARAVLDRSHVRYRRFACGANSLWVGPRQAHGIWLEFRQ